MERLLTIAVLGGITIAFPLIARAQVQPMADSRPDLKSTTASDDLSAIPPLPQGKSTTLGGKIGNIDPVLDELTLRVFGQRPMKILFDERTKVYRDGTRIPLRELRPEEHASVQTVLDGSNVFAISIHMLSEAPEGEAQGHVLSYNPGTRELTIGSPLSTDPIRLQLREDTTIAREGQAAFKAGGSGTTDLVSGALVTVKFDANAKGQAIASHITVLARPGSEFAFSGKLISLDMHSGMMVLLDPRDQKSYQISFNSASTPIAEQLHTGDQVRVSATFDGTRYRAIEITRQ